jgi:hypothetical protein
MPSASGVDTSQSSPGQTTAWACCAGCSSLGAVLSLPPPQLIRRRRNAANRKKTGLHLLRMDMCLLLGPQDADA